MTLGYQYVKVDFLLILHSIFIYTLTVYDAVRTSRLELKQFGNPGHFKHDYAQERL